MWQQAAVVCLIHLQQGSPNQGHPGLLISGNIPNTTPASYPDRCNIFVHKKNKRSTPFNSPHFPVLLQLMWPLRSPKKIFKTTPFTLAINVTDALTGTTVVLGKRQKFGGFFMSYPRNSISDFTIDELYQQEERKVF